MFWTLFDITNAAIILAVLIGLFVLAIMLSLRGATLPAVDVDRELAPDPESYAPGLIIDPSVEIAGLSAHPLPQQR